MPRALLDKVHPSHRQLFDELHARPFPQLDRPASISHIAVFREGHSIEDENKHLEDLFAHFSREPVDWEQPHYIVDLGPMEIRIERHTEFTTYTFFHYSDKALLNKCAMEEVPEVWLRNLPGKVISLVHLGIEKVDTLQTNKDLAKKHFADQRLIASHVIDRSATVWSSLRLDENSFSHYLIQDVCLTPCRAGRLVQRIIEIETYRMMAMLSLPLAREAIPKVRDFDRRLNESVGKLNEVDSFTEEWSLLSNLTALAVENEKQQAQTSHRFRASQAYKRILDERLVELRESEVEGFQTLSEFLLRRTTPAIHTCISMHRNLQDLSQRIDKATDLLRTRVNLNLESQNQQILSSMNQRSLLQLRLQETVEGLSFLVISYYAIGLLKYLFVSLKSLSLPINSDLATGLAMPLVLFLVWRSIKQLKKRLRKSIESVEA